MRTARPTSARSHPQRPLTWVSALRTASVAAMIVGVRPRLLAVVAAVVALALVASSVARADADVSQAGGQLTVTVEAKTGADGNHGILVEPFTDIARNGFRVRQDQFGRPAFRGGANCFHNVVVNDVVCNGGRTSANVTTGDGADVVVALADLRGYFDETNFILLSIALIPVFLIGIVLLFSLPPAGPPCVPGVPPTLPVTVSLGGGSDTVAALPVRDCPAGTSFIEGSFLARLIANGGSGADNLVGGERNDDLNGGADGDLLVGGAGNDILTGSGGVDQLLGNDGNDEFRGFGDGDRMDGGSGIDTVTYFVAAGTTPVAVTVGDGLNNDGPVPATGGTDNVEATVENVFGGVGPDSLFGNDSDNRLTGVLGGDTLRGRGGADLLEGGDGNDNIQGNEGDDTLVGGNDNDTMVGGTERDTFDGGAGDDNIDSRDGVFDPISCGFGFDSADIDLADRPLKGPGSFNAAGCESIDQAAVDDGPPGHAVGRTLRVGRDGRATVTIACPRGARIACRGRLTARVGRPRGRVVGRARYAARLGGRTTVELRLGRRPRGTRIFLETLEQGVSQKGPRSAVRLLTVR